MAEDQDNNMALPTSQLVSLLQLYFAFVPYVIHQILNCP